MKQLFIILFLLIPSFTFASNSPPISWRQIKIILDKEIYKSHRTTLYCSATFNKLREISLPVGFETTKYIDIAQNLDWEHVVPAQNFGQSFKEWQEGHPSCVKNGKPFKHRDCVELVNINYQYMQIDMHNIYPAIASVNRLRSNYNFRMLPDVESNFGSCQMKIFNRKAEPPINSRGQIARSYLYMDKTYKRYNMSDQQKQLMNAWNKMYPPNPWECERAKLIEQIHPFRCPLRVSGAY
ncbi:MAG: endonuclease [Flavobacteriaceae bacterium]|nr:endonuclease [Flavobacteriaceae bacterium]